MNVELRHALARADRLHGIVGALCRQAGIDAPAVDRPASRDDLAASRAELLSLAGAIADRGLLTPADLLSIDAVQAHVDVLDRRLALADALRTRNVPAIAQAGDPADDLLLAAALTD